MIMFILEFFFFFFCFVVAWKYLGNLVTVLLIDSNTLTSY